EADIESARQTLITRIDGSNSQAIATKHFLENYRQWEQWRLPQDSEPTSLSSLLKTLRDKENWTFLEAEEVRELCRKERRNRWGVEDNEKREAQLFDVLTNHMEAAARRFGVAEAWSFYNPARNWLFDW